MTKARKDLLLALITVVSGVLIAAIGNVDKIRALFGGNTAQVAVPVALVTVPVMPVATVTASAPSNRPPESTKKPNKPKSRLSVSSVTTAPATIITPSAGTHIEPPTETATASTSSVHSIASIMAPASDQQSQRTAIKAAVVRIITSNTQKDADTRVIIKVYSRDGELAWRGDIVGVKLTDATPYPVLLDRVDEKEVDPKGPYKLTVNIETRKDSWEFTPRLEITWADKPKSIYSFTKIKIDEKNPQAAREELPRE